MAIKWILVIVLFFFDLGHAAQEETLASSVESFEDKSWKKRWSRSRLEEKNRAKITQKISRSDHASLSVTVFPGDRKKTGKDGKATERAEIKDKQPLGMDKIEWFKFSLFLPEEMPEEIPRLVLAQWKQDCEGICDKNLNPIVALLFNGRKLLIKSSNDDGKKTLFQSSPRMELRNRWLDFVFRVKMSRQKQGLLQVWMNDQKILDHRGQLAYRSGEDSGYFKMGLYRDSMKKPMTVYFDAYQRGDQPSKIDHWLSFTDKNPQQRSDTSVRHQKEFLAVWLPAWPRQSVSVDETIVVQAGQTYDGKNKLHRWVGKGDCSQQEGMPPMFKLEKGSTLRNVVVQGAPDGVHVLGDDVVIEGITNLDVCEDAVTLKGRPKNVLIRNSQFRYCRDKGLQLGAAQRVTIEGNTFYSCATPIRLKPGSRKIIVRNNIFWRARSVVKSEGTSVGDFSNNTVRDTLIVNDNKLGGRLNISGFNKVRDAGRLLSP